MSEAKLCCLFEASGFFGYVLHEVYDDVQNWTIPRARSYRHLYNKCPWTGLCREWKGIIIIMMLSALYFEYHIRIL